MNCKGLKKALFLLFLFVVQPARSEEMENSGSMLIKLPGGDQEYDFRAIDVTLEQALRVFTKTLRVRLLIEETVPVQSKIIQMDQVTRTEYLNRLATTHDLVWYFDGMVLHISAIEDIETRLIEVGELNANTVLDRAEELGLYQPKFLHQVDRGASMIRISGPTSYAAMIENVATTLSEMRTRDVAVSKGSIGAMSSLSSGLSLPSLTAEN